MYSAQQELDNVKNRIANLINRQSQHSHDIISESTKLAQESFYKTRYKNVIHDKSVEVEGNSCTRKEEDLVINNSPKKYSIFSNPIILDKLEDLVYNYNRKKINKSNIVKVSATRESIEKRRTGDNTPLILIQGDEGHEATWVVTQYPLQDNCRFLVPRLGLIINDRIYQTIEDIFMCKGYKNRASNDFKLMLPAVVKSRSNNEWELIESGELLFEEKGML